MPADLFLHYIHSFNPGAETSAEKFEFLPKKKKKRKTNCLLSNWFRRFGNSDLWCKVGHHLQTKKMMASVEQASKGERHDLLLFLNVKNQMFDSQMSLFPLHRFTHEEL